VAQGRLTRASFAGLLVAGAAAEAAAPDVPFWLRAIDFAVGAALVLLSAWALPRDRPAALLGGVTAGLWFLGTLADADSARLSSLGATCVLAHRGPLLHLLLRAPDRALGAAGAAVASAGWAAAWVPVGAGGPATAAVAALATALLLLRARTAPADRRAAGWAAAACLLPLAALWAAAAAGASGTVLLLAVEAAVACSAAVAITAPAGTWSGRAAAPLVVDLPAFRGGASPITEQIAHALGDPDLEIRFALPHGDWITERGQVAGEPQAGNGRFVTRAGAPGGGAVALIHGAAAPVDRRLARAAAAAAALALDAARLDADVRARAADVRASRLRLLTAADRERRAIAERLERPLARLAGVRADLDGELLAELDAARADLDALGSGLYPAAVVHGRLPEELAELVSRSPVAAELRLVGELRSLPEELQAAIWFVCSEALANVARHAVASSARVEVGVRESAVSVAVSDDGRGGAKLERGLRGLEDRVEALGGSFRVESPRGGPTHVRATLPLRRARS
jgi:signal transduction histidine kinase